MSVEYEGVKFEKSGFTVEIQNGLVEELCLVAFQHLNEEGLLEPLAYGLQVDEKGIRALQVIYFLVEFLSTRNIVVGDKPLFQMETAFFMFKKMFPELQGCVELTLDDHGARYYLTRH